MKKIMLSFIIMFSLSNTLFAIEKDNIKSVVESKINKVIQSVKSEMNEIEKKDNIYNELEDVFDFPLMPKIVLGKYRKKFNKEELQNFDDSFTKFIKDFYYDKFKLYDEQKIIVIEPYLKKKRMILKTKIKNGDDIITIVFKLHDRKKVNNWLVYDVLIENVSVIRSNKAQIKEFLKENDKDMKKLINHLTKIDK